VMPIPEQGRTTCALTASPKRLRLLRS
jgi:hypothetical protein